MTKYGVNDIFTPSSPAVQTFVDRKSINNLLVDALRTRGKQVIIYGHTGSGKTTLLYNKLNQVYDNFVSTSCTNTSSFHEVVLSAFDQLGALTISDIQNSSRSVVTMGINADYRAIKTALSYETGASRSIGMKPIVPPQLNAQKLASFFGLTNSCWVIEDFHKMPSSEKVHLAHWMKVFMDESVRYGNVKIVVIGAVGKAKEVIELDFELNNRVSEICVPFMIDEELFEIISKAESKLNIKINDDVKVRIVKASNGVPSIVHQLCLNICHSKNLEETSDILLYFDINDYREALKSHVMNNSGFLQSRYELAIKEKDENTLQIRYHILRCFLLNKNNHLSVKDVVKYFADYKHPQHPELVRYLLNDLTKDERGKVLTHDTDTDTWFFADPFIKVYCLCVVDLNTIDISAQLSLFTLESIEKTRSIQKKEQMDLINKALSTGTFVDF